MRYTARERELHAKVLTSMSRQKRLAFEAAVYGGQRSKAQEMWNKACEDYVMLGVEA